MNKKTNNKYVRKNYRTKKKYNKYALRTIKQTTEKDTVRNTTKNQKKKKSNKKNTDTYKSTLQYSKIHITIYQKKKRDKEIYTRQIHYQAQYSLQIGKTYM